jgi:hypothetical protein
MLLKKCAENALRADAALLSVPSPALALASALLGSELLPSFLLWSSSSLVKLLRPSMGSHPFLCPKSNHDGGRSAHVACLSNSDEENWEEVDPPARRVARDRGPLSDGLLSD